MILKVTAHLKNGFSARFDFALAIDGIIGYQSQLEKLGWSEFSLNQSSADLKPLDDLPIEKEYWQDDWWYQCSRPFFDCKHVHARHIHRRFNVQESEWFVNKIGKIETTKGAYKNYREPVKVFLTPSVTWYVNGDKARITELLQRVTHIGAKRARGFGAVNDWQIDEHDSLDDCRFKRALPLNFAREHGVQEVAVLDWAIKPPYTLDSNVRQAVMVANAL